MLRLLVTAGCLLASPLSAQMFDEVTTDALKLCNERIWFETPKFEGLPNAAITVFPGIWQDNSITVFWNVMWDDPTVRAAGNCIVTDGKIVGVEDYTE